MHLVGFYYKNISRCTVLWMSYKLSLIRCADSQTIRITKYYGNDLLFLLPLCNDLWFIVLGALLRQYKDFQAAKKINKIVMGCRSCDSWRKLFFNLEILQHSLPSTFFLLLCLWYEIGISLWSVLTHITLAVGNMIIFTRLPWID